MATLHSLPTELLHQIFDLILPADIENFACVSRAIYLMSASVLAKHKALIRKYHKLEETEPDESIVGVLRDVLNQPRVGHYVREIELGLLQESEGGGMLLGKKDVDAFTEAAHELRLTFPWRDRTGTHGDDWDTAVEKGNEDLLLAILLPLLPNISSMTLYRPSDESYSLEYLRKLPWYTDKALKSLRSVNLQASGEHGWELDDFRMLAALPSVRRISAPKLESGKACDEYSGYYENPISVRHLKLWDCQLDSNVLMEELQWYEELDSFVYEDYGTLWGRTFRWDPQERSNEPTERAGFNPLHIRTGLLWSANTLRKLTILSPMQREERYIGPLLRFGVLEELYIEWGFLLTSASSRVGRRPIIGLVPPSLVRLKLHDSTGRSKETYTSLLEEVVMAKTGALVPDVDALPNFKRLVFGGWSLPITRADIPRDLKKGCTATGLDLVFSPYEPKSGD